MTPQEVTDVYISGAVLRKIISKHAVSAAEVRQAMSNSAQVYRVGDRSKKRKRRGKRKPTIYAIRAPTDHGRELFVVFSRAAGGKCTVVTAYEPGG